MEVMSWKSVCMSQEESNRLKLFWSCLGVKIFWAPRRSLWKLCHPGCTLSIQGSDSENFPRNDSSKQSENAQQHLRAEGAYLAPEEEGIAWPLVSLPWGKRTEPRPVLQLLKLSQPANHSQIRNLRNLKSHQLLRSQRLQKFNLTLIGMISHLLILMKRKNLSMLERKSQRDN